MAPPKPILVIYTGGTIGCLPGDPDDPLSPLVAAPWERIRDYLPDIAAFDHPVEFLPLDAVDSSDMTPAYWVRLAREIGSRYRDIAGAVILHGTDTMAWTASALTWLLENLAKPVILTGARRPLSAPGSDGPANFMAALNAAARPELRGVGLCFDGIVLRGIRATKTAGPEFLFESPHAPALAKWNAKKGRLQINRAALGPKPQGRFKAHGKMDASVLLIDLFPGLSPVTLRAMLAMDHLKGAVLRTFGSGNAPTDRGFLEVIEWAARERGLALVNVTQCLYGRVDMTAYGAGAGLAKAGVTSGGDMTAEAALTRLMFLFGKGMKAGDVASSFKTEFSPQRHGDSEK